MIFDVPVGKGKVRTALVIGRRIALDHRVGTDAVIDPERYEPNAIGMFLDKNKLLLTIAKFREFLREQQNRRRVEALDQCTHFSVHGNAAYARHGVAVEHGLGPVAWASENPG